MAPSAIAEVIDEASVVVCCGSGGVGKTTTAAALALSAATRTERRVLVLTIDPARRLATALGLSEIGNTETPVVLGRGAAGRLSAAMLDTSTSWDDLVRRHAPDQQSCERIFASPLYRNVTSRFTQSHDYIAVERLYELDQSDRFDLIVVDTPPSRNALDFLDAPDRMADFFSSRLLRWITLPYRLGGQRAGRLGYLASKPFYQVADKILGSQFLEDVAEFFLLFQSMYDGFVERAKEVNGLLHREGTAFVVVSTLESSPLSEAEFFVEELGRRKLAVGALVLNRVLPPVFTDANTLAAATLVTSAPHNDRSTIFDLSEQSEQRVLSEMAASYIRFAALAAHEHAQLRRLAAQPAITATVPLLDRQLTDLDGLAIVARHLDATRTPRPARRPTRKAKTP